MSSDQRHHNSLFCTTLCTCPRQGDLLFSMKLRSRIAAGLQCVPELLPSLYAGPSPCWASNSLPPSCSLSSCINLSRSHVGIRLLKEFVRALNRGAHAGPPAPHKQTGGDGRRRRRVRRVRIKNEGGESRCARQGTVQRTKIIDAVLQEKNEIARGTKEDTKENKN